MALSFRIFPKYTDSIIFTRLMRHVIQKQKFFNYSTTKVLTVEKTNPIKYTTHKVAKVPISNTIGLYKTSDENKLWYEPYVLSICFLVAFIYFGFLRTENDIDEILKGNPDSVPDEVKLVNLKIKLKYCETHKLPTDALKAEIEKLTGTQHKTPFRM